MIESTPRILSTLSKYLPSPTSRKPRAREAFLFLQSVILAEGAWPKGTHLPVDIPELCQFVDAIQQRVGVDLLAYLKGTQEWIGIDLVSRRRIGAFPLC